MEKNKLIIFLCLLVLTLICFCTVSAHAEESEVTFSENDYYKAHYPLNALPLTYEAFIKFPENMDPSAKGGVIFSNFKNNSTPCISFEIEKNGAPKLYVIDDAKKKFTYLFDDVNVYTGKTLHLAITIDTKNKAVKCYVDGVQAQTLNAETPGTLKTSTNPLILGGDYQIDNPSYFKGSISKFALYNSVRSSAHIKLDSEGKHGTDGIVGIYTVEKGKKLLESPVFSYLSFIHIDPFVEKEAAKDYAYSFAVVGDTQILTLRHPKLVQILYSWIKDNVEAKKIKHVFGLGDITNDDSMGEWSLAKKFMTTLNGVVPYSFVRGNHDSVAQYNRYFPYSEFSSTIDGSYDETMTNTYKIFTVGNVKYLAMSIDYAPSDQILSWANEVVSENPDCNVIVTTHAYIYQTNAKYEALWTKFLKKHENISLVICGHEPCDTIRYEQIKGEKGNTVTTLLVDPQNVDRFTNGTGLVAMLYFSEDGSHVDVEYICVTNNKYYLSENQFSLNIDVIDTKTAETAPPQSNELSETTTTPEETPSEVTDSFNEQTENTDSSSTSFTTVIAIALAITTSVIAIIFAKVILLKKKKTK